MEDLFDENGDMDWSQEHIKWAEEREKAQLEYEKRLEEEGEDEELDHIPIIKGIDCPFDVNVNQERGTCDCRGIKYYECSEQV